MSVRLFFIFFVLCAISAGPFSNQTASSQAGSSPQQTDKKVGSIDVNVTGESFLGVMYTKSIKISRSGDKFNFSYECNGRTTTTKCPCRNFEADLDAREGESLIATLSAISDSGSTCCDHPYSSIVIAMEDGTRKTITSSRDILKSYEKTADGIPKVLGIDCKRPAPWPAAKP